jgi:hypothetical protein
MSFANVMGRALAGMSRTRLEHIQHGPTLNRDVIFKAIARCSNITCGSLVHWRREPEPGSAFPTKATWFTSNPGAVYRISEQGWKGSKDRLSAL